jgi:hypothetical protein
MIVDETLRINYRGNVAPFLVSSDMPADAELMNSFRPDLRAVSARPLSAQNEPTPSL